MFLSNILTLKIKNNIPTESPLKSRDEALKRNRKKFVAVNIARELFDKNERSPLRNSYKNSFFCNHTRVVENGIEKSGGYCKNRWCAICQPILMGKIINEYLEEWQKLKDPHFVTLTARTVSREQLKKEIERRRNSWRYILKKARKRIIKNFDGTRKT